MHQRDYLLPVQELQTLEQVQADQRQELVKTDVRKTEAKRLMITRQMYDGETKR